MQGILYLLREHVIKLQIKIRNAESEKSPTYLDSVKNWGLQFRFQFLKSICEVLWSLCLLKTSFLVTRTPLTTLKSLSRNCFDPALTCDLKDKMLEGVKDIQEALVGDLVRDLKSNLGKVSRLNKSMQWNIIGIIALAAGLTLGTSFLYENALLRIGELYLYLENSFIIIFSITSSFMCFVFGLFYGLFQQIS